MVSVGQTISPRISQHKKDTTPITLHKNHSIQKAISDLKNFTHELYLHFSNDFLDTHFSNKVANSLSKDLTKLDKTTLTNVYSNMTNSNNQYLTTEFQYQSPSNVNQLDDLLKMTKNRVVVMKRGGRKQKINSELVQSNIYDKLSSLINKWNEQSQLEKIQIEEVKQPQNRNDLMTNIIRNIIVRGNLIGAIQSVLPSDESNSSLLQQRMKLLMDGEVCLPSATAQSDELMKFMNAYHKHQCQVLGGKTTSSKNIPEDHKYWQIVEELSKSYQEGIDELKQLQEKLMELTPIKNDELDHLAQKVKQILNDLYTETEIYYFISVLSLLEL